MPQQNLTLPPDDKLLLRNHMCFPMYLLTSKMVKLYTPALNDLGITYPQFLVLCALWETDHQQVTDIGRVLRLDTGSLTPLLQRLERMGHLTRTRDSSDKRRVTVSLTQQGIALYHQASESIQPLKEFARHVGCDAAYTSILRNNLYDLLGKLDRIPLITWRRS